MQAVQSYLRPRLQILMAAGVGALAAVVAWGALDISSEAGYAGVAPNFLPWVVCVILTLCAVLLLREALTGGFREMGEASGSATGNWGGLAWVSAGLLLNAALLTTVGFILSCTLCFVLAVQGMRLARGEGVGFSVVRLVKDAALGFAISAPVYWMFSKLLAINLPGLTETGWI